MDKSEFVAAKWEALNRLIPYQGTLAPSGCDETDKQVRNDNLRKRVLVTGVVGSLVPTYASAY